uniref:Uncharacterized protein n=1 Tax=Alexandrium catenella TaxID=2925 RepID=A0A7S1WAY4_ALECA
MGVRKPPPAAAGRRQSAVSKGTLCPTCGRPGWVSSSPSAGARPAGKQGLDSSEDSPSSPSKTSQDLKPRKPRLPVTPTERRRSLQQRHSVVLQEIKDIAEKADKGIGGDDTGLSSASEAGGIFSEAEAKEFSDVDEIEGSTKEAVFAPLKLTELVNSGWPGFFHEGGGTFITAQSARDKKLLKRYWRHEVATGGVSNRDAETIVRGRRDSAVETPPLQGPDVEDMEISGTSAPSRPSQEREPREPKEPADAAAAKSARRARVVAPTDGPSGTR